MPRLYPESIQSSLHLLGFNDATGPPSSLKELNKRYHILALQHHPDKAASDDLAATERFKDINEAHKRLKDYFYTGCRNNPDMNDSDYSNTDDLDYSSGYDNILQMFIKSIIVKIRSSANHASASAGATTSDAIHSIIQTVLNKGAQSAVLLFRNMDKQASMTITAGLIRGKPLKYWYK